MPYQIHIDSRAPVTVMVERRAKFLVMASHWITAMRRVQTVIIAVLGIAVMVTTSQPASADAGFRKWVRDFRGIAIAKGVRASTYDQLFAGIDQPDPEVLKKANYQPEFVAKIWDYLDARVNQTSIETGQHLAKTYKPWLDRIERKFGVDRNVLLAIWSLESQYGAVLANREIVKPLARSLATLAHGDRKRAKFARSQLIAAMKIVDAGHVSAAGLVGSWAGAMGHTQFIPTSYRLYAVDMDGDGRADIWNSPPDALATAANLLRKNGWQTQKTWGYEVVLPANFATGANRNKTRTLGKWAKQGVRRVKGRQFPWPAKKAVLKLPAGGNGPAFLMMRNFYILKRYNNADKYALAVGHLADRIAGYGELVKKWPRGYIPLSFDESKELQLKLSRLGLYDGEIDGRIGSGSRSAIKTFQHRIGLKKDGIPSKKLLKRIRASVNG